MQRRIGLIAFCLALAAALPAAALTPGCDCDDREALAAVHAEIASAATVAEARALATGEVRLAHSALDRASRLAPFSENLAAATQRLDRYVAAVEGADRTEQIASEFSRLVQLDGPRADSGCDYTTGEIVAIVLGFILGIIPGLILLVLLC